jgi:hypothetical protein
MGSKKFIVVSGVAEPCPRCRVPAEIREHRHITEKQLNQPFYYSRWFRCQNQQCKTNLFMRDEHRVWNKNGAAYALQKKRAEFSELAEQELNLFRMTRD